MFVRAIRRAVPSSIKSRNSSSNPILQCREKFFTKNNMGKLISASKFSLLF